MTSRYQSLALYKGAAYVPTIGEASSGLFGEVDPVAIADPSQVPLSSMLGERLQEGHVRIGQRPDLEMP